MYSVEVFKHIDDLGLLMPEWEKLAASLSPRLPFASPDWSIVWWKHFARKKLTARDDLRIFALRDGTGDLVAVCPMMLTSRPGCGRFAFRELQFLGADSNITEMRGPVCQPAVLPAVLSALKEHFHRHGREWDWIQWRGLVLDEHAATQFARQARIEPDLQQSDYFLKPGGDWEQFRASLPRNIKESLRKCYKSLERDGHRFELRVVETAHDAPAAIDLFLAMHHARASRRDTIHHINVFASPTSCAFLHDYMKLQAEAGNLRIFQLWINDRPVATRIGIVLGQEIFLYYSGYDNEWSRYSVMTTTVAEAIKWSIGSGFHTINLSSGTDVSKTRWRPQQVDYIGGFELSPKPAVHFAFLAMQGLRDARTTGRPEAAPVTGGASAPKSKPSIAVQ